MINDTVERGLYIALLVLFIGNMYGLMLLLNFGHKLDQQLRDLKSIQANQAQAVTQLNNSVDTLKADNKYNLAVIICMLQVPVEQRTTDLETSCRAAVPAVSSGAAPTPTHDNSSTTQSGTSRPTPTATPKPGNSILNRLESVLGL